MQGRLGDTIESLCIDMWIFGGFRGFQLWGYRAYRVWGFAFRAEGFALEGLEESTWWRDVPAISFAPFSC